MSEPKLISGAELMGLLGGLHKLQDFAESMVHPRMTDAQIEAVRLLWDAASDIVENIAGGAPLLADHRDALVLTIRSMAEAFTPEHPIYHMHDNVKTPPADRAAKE